MNWILAIWLIVVVPNRAPYRNIPSTPEPSASHQPLPTLSKEAEEEGQKLVMYASIGLCALYLLLTTDGRRFVMFGTVLIVMVFMGLCVLYSILTTGLFDKKNNG